MKILVTGGLGFVGSHVVDAYVQAGHEVVVVDTCRTGYNPLPEGVKFYDRDITSPDLEGVFQRERPDVVNHHAANPSVPLSIEQPDLDAQINLMGTLHLLRLSVAYQVTQFLFASTAEVYGSVKEFPLREDSPLHPESPYGIAKLAAEMYVEFYGKHHPLQTTILRYANLYGPRQLPSGGGVVARFTESLLTGKPVTLHGGGTQTRDFLYVEDAAEANVKALEKSGVVCIGSGELVSFKRLLEILEVHTGVATVGSQTPRTADFSSSALSSSRALEVLGWEPKTSLHKGLYKTVQAMQETLK